MKKLFARIRARFRIPLAGRVFLLMTLLVIMAGWNTGQNLLYILFAGLASFVSVSPFVSAYALRRLTARREAPGAIHRGERFGVTVYVTNLRRWIPVYSLRLELASEPGKAIGFIPYLPPRATARLRVSQQFDRRGVYMLPDLVIVCSFPFGLIEARRKISAPAEVVVFPRIQATRLGFLDQLTGSGQTHRITRGHGDEFFSLREYVEGDDLRLIAWRASARQGKLLVRELEQQSTRAVLFCLDTRMRGYLLDFDEMFENAIELVASLGVTLLQRNFSVALVTSTETLPEGEGQSHALLLLHMLARVGVASADADDPSIRARGMELSERSMVLEVSPDPGEWGSFSSGGGRVIHPQEVVRA